MKEYYVTIDFDSITIMVEAETPEDALVAAHKEMTEEQYTPDAWYVGYVESEDEQEVYSA